MQRSFYSSSFAPAVISLPSSNSSIYYTTQAFPPSHFSFLIFCLSPLHILHLACVLFSLYSPLLWLMFLPFKFPNLSFSLFSTIFRSSSLPSPHPFHTIFLTLFYLYLHHTPTFSRIFLIPIYIFPSLTPYFLPTFSYLRPYTVNLPLLALPSPYPSPLFSYPSPPCRPLPLQKKVS
jgi:hypothetical protein